MGDKELSWSRQLYLPAAAAALLLAGCGGNSISSYQAQGPHPSLKTKQYVSALLTGYDQTIVCTSFTGYGKRLVTHGAIVFDPTLSLWYRIRLGSSALSETMFQDQAGKDVAGSLTYIVNDAALTTGGTFSVTAGRYAGLTGSYFQSLDSPGFNGSIGLIFANGATTDSQFAVQLSSSGVPFGTATNGVSEPGGYLQTELTKFNADSTMSASTTDSNSMTSSFSFAADFSGTGAIMGKAPGLPASVIWTTGGNGVVTFADGSKTSFSAWQLVGS